MYCTPLLYDRYYNGGGSGRGFILSASDDWNSVVCGLDVAYCTGTDLQLATQLGSNPFNTDPAGPFFAGRQGELALFRQWLAAIHSQPQHACVIGRQGEGKTSFLQKAQSEASAAGLIACRARLDAKRSPEQNIYTIIEKLLEEIDSAAKLGLRNDWKSGKGSIFRVPNEQEIRVDDLVKDFQTLIAQLHSAGKKAACLICVDDGQWIHPAALSLLRNALQDVGAGYMLLLALRNDSANVTNIVEGLRMITEFATTSTDTGLPRLFADNLIALGPFDNQVEADACIRKRLEHTPVKFADQVIADIGMVTGRYPHTMMVLAKAVYFLAEAANNPGAAANNAMFRQAFVNTQKPLVDAANDFVAQETNTRKQVYRATLRNDGVFTPLQIAKDMLVGATSIIKDSDFAVDPVSVALDRLVSAGFCLRSGVDQYQWSDPLRTHALRIVVA